MQKKKAITIISLFSIMLMSCVCGCDSDKTESSSTDKSSEVTDTATVNTSSKGFTYVEIKSESDDRTDNYMGFIRYEGGIIITGYVGSDTDIVIPEEIDGKPVIGINDFAFCPLRFTSYGETGYDLYDDDLNLDFTEEDTEKVNEFINNHERYSKIKSIKIPASIVWYGDDPFLLCDSLESVTVYGESNAAIFHAGKMFNYCYSLEKVEGTVRYIGLGSEVTEYNFDEFRADYQESDS